MRMVFLLNEYRPYGGQQRDCVRLAEEAAGRGHEVTILTRGWQGERLSVSGVDVVTVGFRGRTNAARDRHFVRQAQDWLQEHPHDLRLGFIRMSGLDAYFAADPCFEAKVRRLKPRWFRWTLRYRRFASAERTIFRPGTKPHILLLHSGELETYHNLYGTERHRLHVLPPGIHPPSWRAQDQHDARQAVRQELGLAEKTPLLLLAGSGFRTKGLDRAIRSLALAQEAHLVVAGQDHPDPFLALARKLGVEPRVHFLGGRSDLPRWMLGSDLLLHPAYSENTGTVIVEALVHGLPVIASAVCGFSTHIRASKGGLVMEEPFVQEAFDQTVLSLLSDAPRRNEMRRAGSDYGVSQDLYSCHQRAVDVLETIAT